VSKYTIRNKELVICALAFAIFTVFSFANIYAVEYTASSLRDPFVVPSQFKTPTITTATATSFKLQGIVFEGPKLKAIINEKVVGIGDVVDGAKVISISKNGVKLLVDSEEVTIKIEEK